MTCVRCDIDHDALMCDADDAGLYHDRPIKEERGRPAVSVKAPDEVWAHVWHMTKTPCDSPELAATLARLRYYSDPDVHALLRLVDESRAKLDDLYADLRTTVSLCGAIFEPSNTPERVLLTCRLPRGHVTTHSYRPPKRDTDEYEKDIAFMADNEATVQRERDELRVKLAEAESSLDKAATANGRLSDVNHRLYNANKRLSLEADQSRKRAEAAEARVRKLTDALFAATGGHVDLDKLEGKP